MKPRATKRTQGVKRGRRSHDEKASGHWRLSIREVTLKDGPYTWTSSMVQGFKDERGKWARKKFKTLAEAEAFKRTMDLEHVTRDAPQRNIVTGLSQEQAREAEIAFSRLAEIGHIDGRPASMIDAVTYYAAHIRTTTGIERVSLRDARISCLNDKLKRGQIRHRSAIQLESTFKAFERWLRMLPRYASEIDPEWTPPVCEVTAEDVLAFIGSLRSKAGMQAAPKTRNNVRADLRSLFNWTLGVEGDEKIPGVNRRWHSYNPADSVPISDVPASAIVVLSVKESEDLMRHVEKFKDGRLVPYFALALFAGIRPGGEILKLAEHPGLLKPCPEASGRPLIDLERSIITIPAETAKDKKGGRGKKRVIDIQPNLRRWLIRYGTDILPTNHDRGIKAIRSAFTLPHDVLRHSFISFHIGAFRSKRDTSLQAGNSEDIIDRHYLNIPTQEEGKAFFQIMPADTDAKILPMRAAK